MLDDGWYLMSSEELERELPFLDDPSTQGPIGTAVSLSIEEGLAYKMAGNLPDTFGRSLRLVLRTADPDPEAVSKRRMEFEPDFHDAPTWRRPGSKPVNVIPLRARSSEPASQAWWDEQTMADLETEWLESGTVGGIAVPGEYRSFVLKTVASLRAAGRPVTPTTVADSIARWVSPEDAAEIRAVLMQADQRK